MLNELSILLDQLLYAAQSFFRFTGPTGWVMVGVAMVLLWFLVRGK